MILIFLSLLIFVLWPNMRSILGDVPCSLKKNVYPVVGWSVLYMSVWSNWSFLLFKSSISLLIFCLVVLINLYKSQFLICKMMKKAVPTPQVDIRIKEATPH